MHCKYSVNIASLNATFIVKPPQGKSKWLQKRWKVRFSLSKPESCKNAVCPAKPEKKKRYFHRALDPTGNGKAIPEASVSLIIQY